jgi:hypothetical protein
MHCSTLSALLLLVAAAWGCAPPASVAGGSSPGPLISSLQVRTGNGEVRFTLQVTNTGNQPLDLLFPTGQSFDFTVRRRAGGQELWRWSADMMFTQAFRSQTLAPDSTLRFEESWRPPAGLTGEFTARGVLTVQEHRVEQEAFFRLP